MEGKEGVEVEKGTETETEEEDPEAKTGEGGPGVDLLREVDLETGGQQDIDPGVETDLLVTETEKEGLPETKDRRPKDKDRKRDRDRSREKTSRDKDSKRLKRESRSRSRSEERDEDRNQGKSSTVFASHDSQQSQEKTEDIYTRQQQEPLANYGVDVKQGEDANGKEYVFNAD